MQRRCLVLLSALLRTCNAWSSCSSITVSPNPRDDVAKAIDGSTSTWSWITQSAAQGLQTISCAINVALPIAGLRITRGEEAGFQPLSVRFSVDGTPVTGFAHSCDGSSSASTVLQNPTAVDFHLVEWSTSNDEVCTFDWSPAMGSAVEVAFESAGSGNTTRIGPWRRWSRVWFMRPRHPQDRRLRVPALLLAFMMTPTCGAHMVRRHVWVFTNEVRLDDPHMRGAHAMSPCVGIHERSEVR